MATGGPYYSEFLLTVICAHAAKYQTEDCADLLLSRARHLLGTAITQPSSIPTVQALLQLSARELASGLISQSWVYSGVAFRMASDLGLQHSDPRIKSLAPFDREIRLRLYWSCYFWDKYVTRSKMRPCIDTSLVVVEQQVFTQGGPLLSRKSCQKTLWTCVSCPMPLVSQGNGLNDMLQKSTMTPKWIYGGHTMTMTRTASASPGSASTCMSRAIPSRASETRASSPL
jgi:hypothetical protein